MYNYTKRGERRQLKAKRHKKLTKARVAAIISSAVVIALFVSLVITNIFIPVKYITAYMVAAGQRQKGVLTVTFIDVGYGDCTLCELPDGKVLLIALFAMIVIFIPRNVASFPS